MKTKLTLLEGNETLALDFTDFEEFPAEGDVLTRHGRDYTVKAIVSAVVEVEAAPEVAAVPAGAPGSQKAKVDQRRADEESFRTTPKKK